MKKLLSLFLVAALAAAALCAESYEQLLAKAKSYEDKKKWAYALGAYYDAMALEAEQGTSGAASEKYSELKSLIKSGQPGRGEFGVFEQYNEWKNLLMNAEKYGTEYGRYAFSTGKLKQKELDHATRTATYEASITMEESERYKATIGVIESGYWRAWNSDWKNLPKPRYWPEISVSGLSSKSNLVNGAAVYRTENAERGFFEDESDIAMAYYMDKKGSKVNIMELATGNKSQTVVYNAFCCERAGGATFKIQSGATSFFYSTLYDLKFNIVDENGKEIVPPKRVLVLAGMGHWTWNGGLGIYHEISQKYSSFTSIEFSGIPESVMKKIDSGKARINLLNVYLEYGTYNKADDTVAETGDTRAFIKKFPEVEISREKVKFFDFEEKEKIRQAEEQKRIAEEEKKQEEERIERIRQEEERIRQEKEFDEKLTTFIDNYYERQKALTEQTGILITGDSINVKAGSAAARAGLRTNDRFNRSSPEVVTKKDFKERFLRYYHDRKTVTQDDVDQFGSSLNSPSSEEPVLAPISGDEFHLLGIESGRRVRFEVRRDPGVRDYLSYFFVFFLVLFQGGNGVYWY